MPQFILLFVSVAVCLACLSLLVSSPTNSPRWLRRLITYSEPEQRARSLLREVLSEQEHQQLSRTSYLEVPSPTKSGRVYRIPEIAGRVEVYEEGWPVMGLCLQPVRYLPDADIVLMHKLMIEADEEQYLQVANQLPPSTLY